MYSGVLCPRFASAVPILRNAEQATTSFLTTGVKFLLPNFSTSHSFLSILSILHIYRS